jgi:hypothetical protein
VRDGALYTQPQLEEAVAFFEKLSDVPSGLIGSWGGLVMNRAELGRAVERWDAWYAEHAGSIRWDPDKGEFTTATSADGTR